MSHAWNWKGRCRVTGKVEGFYTKGPYPTVNELRDHLGAHMRGLEFVSAEPADREPLVKVPVNPRYFQAGILDIARREWGGRRSFGDLGRKPIAATHRPLAAR